MRIVLLLLPLLATFFTSNRVIASEIGKSEICRAAIAAIMGHEPRIIKVDKSADGVDYLSYIRDDGTLWSYRCKISGNEIIWASDTGRWRTDSLDEKIVYKISEDHNVVTITQTFSDSSEIVKTYMADHFK